DLLRRLGAWSDASAEYERAIALTQNDAERAFLARRLAGCGARARSGGWAGGRRGAAAPARVRSGAGARAPPGRGRPAAGGGKQGIELDAGEAREVERHEQRAVRDRRLLARDELPLRQLAVEHLEGVPQPCPGALRSLGRLLHALREEGMRVLEDGAHVAEHA